MGTSLDAIRLVITSILSTEPWRRDPGVVSMPWNIEMEKNTLARRNPKGSNGNLPLRFGIFWSDGVVAPQPPIARGLRMLHKMLQADGHVVGNTCPDLGIIASGLIFAALGCRLGPTIAINGEKSSCKYSSIL